MQARETRASRERERHRTGASIVARALAWGEHAALDARSTVFGPATSRRKASLALALLVGAACDSGGTSAPRTNDNAATPGTIAGGTTAGRNTAGGATAGATESDSGTTSDAAAETGAPPASVDAGPTKPAPGTPGAPGGIPGPGVPPAHAALCGRESSAFDLSAMKPTSASPFAFRAAWDQEAQASSVPGIAFKLSDAIAGPVTASIGAVHSVGTSIWAFSGSPLSSSGITVIVDNPSAYHFVVPTTDRGFMISFGTATVRRGFLVKAVAVDGFTDTVCERLSVRVTMTVPSSNGTQVFGGATLSASLGAPTIDTDNDGAPDSWKIILEGATTPLAVP